jgi:DNA-binding MarR family transcriptional regulator
MKDQFVSDGIVLENAIAFWVYRVYQTLRKDLYRSFGELGHPITPEQWMILVRLWERDGCIQNDLCESTLKDKPTISRVLDGMEARGLLERRPDPADARGRRVYLTREGKALRRVLVPAARAVVGRLEAGSSEADLQATRRVLRRITENLGGEEA